MKNDDFVVSSLETNAECRNKKNDILVRRCPNLWKYFDRIPINVICHEDDIDINELKLIRTVYNVSYNEFEIIHNLIVSGTFNSLLKSEYEKEIDPLMKGTFNQYKSLLFPLSKPLCSIIEAQGGLPLKFLLSCRGKIFEYETTQDGKQIKKNAFRITTGLSKINL